MKTPALFVTDFGPFPAFESDDYTDALEKLGKTLPKPKSLLIMSGHWEASGDLLVSSAKIPGVIHDYFGFPREFYEKTYSCPGDPKLAQKVAALLAGGNFPSKLDPSHKLDHGSWVPLSRIYPKADVPVVQLSVPTGRSPRDIFEIGRLLAPLREEGVVLIGSGALSHNLSLALVRGKNDEPDEWATGFDRWLMSKLAQNDKRDLFNYRSEAPSARLAAPTNEHFDPLFFVLGAAGSDKPNFLYQAIRHANGLMKIIRFE